MYVVLLCGADTSEDVRSGMYCAEATGYSSRSSSDR